MNGKFFYLFPLVVMLAILVFGGVGAGLNLAQLTNPIGCDKIADCVNLVAKFLFEIGVPIAVIMIIYAAFLYMTSGGSDEKVTTARKALTYAVVGLAILFLAWGLTSVIKEILGANSGS